MRFHLWVSCLAATVLLAACGPVHKNVVMDEQQANKLNVVAVQLKSKGEFEVIMDRATATAGPAFMFGLVGAAVASSMNHSADQKREDSVAKYLGNIDHQVSVSKGLYEGLKLQERLTFVALEAESAEVDGVLELTIKDWGLKVTDQRQASSVTPFVQLECVVRSKVGKKKLMDLQETYYGGTSRFFQRYESDGALLVSELEAILHRAGKQVGTRMAYTLGGKKS